MRESKTFSTNCSCNPAHSAALDDIRSEVRKLKEELAEIYTRLAAVDRVHASTLVKEAGNFRLNDEEILLLEYVGQGVPLVEIGKACHWSVSTTERHLVKLCDKCGVTNRSQLIVWGTLHGYCSLLLYGETDATCE